MEILTEIAPSPSSAITFISETLSFVPKLFKAIGEFFHNFQTTLLKWAIEWLVGPQKAMTPPKEATFNNELQRSTQAFLKSTSIRITNKPLGSGKAATAYEGMMNGKKVAIKMMNGTKEKFQIDEGEALALTLPKQINAQKNIALILYDETTADYFYVDKNNMQAFQDRNYAIVATVATMRSGHLGDMPFKSAKEIKDVATTAAQFLEKIHVQGILHRDFHFQNILFYPSKKTSQNKIKVHDFGLSKKYDATGFSNKESEAYTYYQNEMFSLALLCDNLLAEHNFTQHKHTAGENFVEIQEKLQNGERLTPTQIVDLFFKDIE
ncbi:MAG: protein kinase [Chlamydiia bacterium]|nr:protein kinase [Chlamydiia bacterium]